MFHPAVSFHRFTFSFLCDIIIGGDVMEKYIGIDIGGTKCAVIVGEYENEEIDGLYEECLKEYLSCVSFKACYRKSSLNFSSFFLFSPSK